MVVTPVMIPVLVGMVVTVTLKEAVVPFPHVLLGVTLMLPTMAVLKFTPIVLVPCPLTIDAPEGTVQV